jgi:prepilin-type processing-associated H-X9-DG protein
MNANWPEIEGPRKPRNTERKRLSEPDKRVVGCVTAAAILVWGSVFTFYTFMATVKAALSQSCVINLQELSQGMLQYSVDNDGYLPPSNAWHDLEPTDRAKDLGCPEWGGADESSGYAMLAALSSKQTSTIKSPATMPMIFDSNLTGRNAAGGIDNLPNPPRHGTSWPFGGQSPRNNVAYADGHVKGVPPSGAPARSGSSWRKQP